MKKYLFATGLLVCITPFTQAETSAQCSAQQDQIIAQALNITTEDLAQRQLDSTCKTDPENAGYSLVGYAVLNAPYNKENYSSEDCAKVQLIIARLDKQQILQKYHSTEEIDAAFDISEGSFRIDTARYKLAQNVRAFGVRFNSSARGPSAPEAGYSNELALFINDNGELRTVFDYPMSVWQFADPINNRDIQSAEMTLSVAKQQHNGFYDLVLNTKLSYKKESETQSVKRTSKTEQVRFEYDGQRYQPVKKVWWLANVNWFTAQ